MKLFGLEIRRAKAAVSPMTVGNSPGLVGPIGEPWGGAWQSLLKVDNASTLLTFSAVYACVTGIAQDIAKLDVRVVSDNGDGTETPVEATSPLAAFFRRPNHFQNRIQYVQHWVLSRLLTGNTVALKERDARNMVRAAYVLNWQRVAALVAETGDVFYRLGRDDLAGIQAAYTIPADEVMHDRHAPLWHPLEGITPIRACAMGATMGNRITAQSATFFGNMSRPSGMLTADAPIGDELAGKMKRQWRENYSGRNIGDIAVGGNGLKYLPIGINAEDAQLIEQLKWSVADVATAFHYPLYKLGGGLPQGAKVEDLNQAYYSECLQPIMEDFELVHTLGLELPAGKSVAFDLDGLLRMDQKSAADVEAALSGSGIKAPDEARRRFNLRPVPGGKYPYLQQQNYSLEALAKRDAQDPLSPKAPPPPAPADDEIPDDQAPEEAARAFRRGLIEEEASA